MMEITVLGIIIMMTIIGGVPGTNYRIVKLPQIQDWAPAVTRIKLAILMWAQN